MSVRPITDTLRSIQRGAVLDDASEKLADLVKAVDAAGKPGKLVIEITVKKASRGGAMHITAKTTAKKPGGEDTFADCEALAQAGLMIRHRGNELTGNDDVFTVTEAGKTVARLGDGG